MGMQLEIRGLTVFYGSIKAVKGIDLRVGEGEIVCLIGANGAGKTTTLKAIAGLLPISAGSVHFAGQALTRKPAFEIARLGLNLVPEGRGVFPRMTVTENLLMGAYARSDAQAVKRDLDKVCDLLPRLAERRAQKAGLLSGGEQQMLALARAMLSRPRMLMLDEPSMGLAPMLVQTVFGIIREIAASGVTLLLVEQNAHLALQTAQRGYVMDGGQILVADSAAALKTDPSVSAAYLGEL
ncbi:MAG TPA: ABC transporter ATP-binding protein [Thiobacillaceae bacterium]|nr:ABC transporter ATP-binding protein [Thiobacillaceae bacterium]